jgi:hypothetical protein
MPVRFWIALFLLLGVFSVTSRASAEYKGTHQVNAATSDCVRKLSSQITDKQGGTCCSEADGSEPNDLRQVGTDGNGRPLYEVQFNIEGVPQWIEVRPEAIIPAQNACGIRRTLAWTSPVNGNGPKKALNVRCLIIGTMY